MNNKHTFLFTIFTMSFLLLFDSWQRFNGQPSFFMSIPATQIQNSTKNNNNLNTTSNIKPENLSSNTIPLNSQTKGELITLTTGLYELKIDTKGATINEVKLLKHLDKHSQAPINLLGNEHAYYARSGLTQGPNHNSIFTPISTNKVLTADKLEFSLSSNINGIELIKTYTLHKDSYLIDVNFKTINSSNTELNTELYTEITRNGDELQESKFYSTFTGAGIYSSENKFKKIDFNSMNKGENYNNTTNNGWISMIQHYFVTSWIIPQNSKFQHKVYAEKIDNNLYRVGFTTPIIKLNSSNQVQQNIQLFIGPQQERMLEKTATGLDLVKDYGWVTIFAKPLFWLLENIFKYVGNWGWSIILLTLLLKTIFFPLTAASQRSMAKMKNLQPKIAALKEQLSSQPQKMQQEMLSLYRKEKVNPMGGCLPMLIQIPVFIALYFVLLSSIEMRNAPWIGWIKDLSSPDKFYILPILMAASMFLQIKMNPKPADPMQAKVMLIVPMIFSVMFFFFPSGLVLYYVVNNLLSILQQWYINKSLNV